MKINNLILSDFPNLLSNRYFFVQYSPKAKKGYHLSLQRRKFKRKPEVVFFLMISYRGSLRNHPSALRKKFKRKPEVVF